MIKNGLLRSIRSGVNSLALHKLRSLLTTLGVLFGTSSVISMLAIGEGASFEAQEQIRLLESAHSVTPLMFERIQGLRREVYDSRDYREGLSAFLEKRSPDFVGE